MDNLESHSLPLGSQKKNHGAYGKPRSKSAAHVANTSSKTSTTSCPLCESSHYLAKCGWYQAKTIQQRKDVTKYRRCYNCLGPHAMNKCNSTKRCLKCGKRYHTSIYDANYTASAKQPAIAQTIKRSTPNKDQTDSNSK